MTIGDVPHSQSPPPHYRIALRGQRYVKAHLTCLGWCCHCRRGARGWRLLVTDVSGWGARPLWSMIPAGGSGCSEWLTNPGTLVVRQPPPPPGRLYKSGGAGKPVVRKNFFRTTGSMYKPKSGFGLYIDPVARKNFFRATGSMRQNHIACENGPPQIAYSDPPRQDLRELGSSENPLFGPTPP